MSGEQNFLCLERKRWIKWRNEYFVQLEKDCSNCADANDDRLLRLLHTNLSSHIRDGGRHEGTSSPAHAKIPDLQKQG